MERAPATLCVSNNNLAITCAHKLLFSLKSKATAWCCSKLWVLVPESSGLPFSVTLLHVPPNPSTWLFRYPGTICAWPSIPDRPEETYFTNMQRPMPIPPFMLSLNGLGILVSEYKYQRWSWRCKSFLHVLLETFWNRLSRAFWPFQNQYYCVRCLHGKPLSQCLLSCCFFLGPLLPTTWAMFHAVVLALSLTHALYYHCFCHTHC